MVATLNAQSTVIDDGVVVGLLNEHALRSKTNLFDLGEMEVTYEAPTKTLWTYMAPHQEPNFSLNMLDDILTMQAEIRRLSVSGAMSPRYFVFGSRFPGVFNLGGDLGLFCNLIQSQNREALHEYAIKCIRVFYQNYTSMDVPLICIALVQGDARGGGFEGALSFNVIVAERGTKFSMPESMFGLFPGMGAHAQLVRLLGRAAAERMILSGKTFLAEELYDMGIVHVLAERGEGQQAVRDYIKHASHRFEGHFSTYRATQQIDPITFDELQRIVEIWVDTALKLTAHNIKLMRRLAYAQSNLVTSHLSVQA